MKQIYSLESYDYKLPQELIAQSPPAKRGDSRLLVLDSKTGAITHTHFSRITEYLNKNDCLVLNDTRVIPARLFGKKKSTGAKIEILLLERLKKNDWTVLMRNSRRMEKGDSVLFPARIKLDVVEKRGKEVIVRFNISGKKLLAAVEKTGTIPLPPYITQNTSSPLHKSRYQTVYARKSGAKAAPTAGLHFTGALLSKIRKKGVKTVFATLHVGFGTFESVNTPDIRGHRMHSEWFELSRAAARDINNTIKTGGRIICAGTTSLRAVESTFCGSGVVPMRGSTQIFIYPGIKINACSALITNFHLPKTTLFMLACAFGGTDNIKKAYECAVRQKYRFFSYGDAMLII